jgi:hypothetical protein
VEAAANAGPHVERTLIFLDAQMDELDDGSERPPVDKGRDRQRGSSELTLAISAGKQILSWMSVRNIS